MQSGVTHVRTVIVDDSPTFLRTVRSFLDHQDLVEIIATAENAEDAFLMVEALNPDLVLMDLQMPGINGLEATAELHRRCPGTRIIMVTGHDNSELRQASLDMGAQALVSKSRLAQELPTLLKDIRTAMERGAEN